MSSKPVRQPIHALGGGPSSTRRRKALVQAQVARQVQGSYPVHVLVPTVGGAS